MKIYDACPVKFVHYLTGVKFLSSEIFIPLNPSRPFNWDEEHFTGMKTI
jgi:hypothetical protein